MAEPADRSMPRGALPPAPPAEPSGSPPSVASLRSLTARAAWLLLGTAAVDAVIAAASQPRALRRAGVMLALASLTRPEGPLVAAVLGAVWLGARIAGRIARGRATAAPRGVRDEAIAIAWFLALW